MSVKPCKIFVIDDDPAVSRLICSLLRKKGYQPVSRRTARRIVDLAESCSPRLIILDAHLAGGPTGFETCGLLKQDPLTKDIPVLMISGTFKGPEYAEQARQRGAFGYIQKPFDLGDFERKVCEALVLSPSTVAQTEPGRAANRQRPPARLLSVEDDPEYQKFLRLAMIQAGCGFEGVGNLRDAREALTTAATDMVILDEDLPDGSGLDFCREIRGCRRFSKLPILVLTGKKSVWNRDEWLRAGADQCWPKVFSTRRLQNSILGFLRRLEWNAAAPETPIDGLTVARASRIITYRSISSKPMSFRELAFFDLLCNAYPGALLRQEISRKSLLHYGKAIDSGKALNVLVNRVKKKLPPALSNAIRAVYRQGYRLAVTPKTLS